MIAPQGTGIIGEYHLEPTWQPLYAQARFIGPLVKNLLAIVKYYQVQALAWANSTELGGDGSVLTPFAAVNQSDELEPNYPYCIIEAEDTQKDEQENGERINEDHTLNVEVAIMGDGSDAERLADLITIYVRAVDMMITSAPVQALLSGYGPAIGVTWEVKEHRYSRQGTLNTSLLRAARMTVAVKFSEVMA